MRAKTSKAAGASRRATRKTAALTAVLHKEEDMYVAECPEVGTVSQGFTIEEAVGNLKEATELYMEEFPPKRVSKAWLTTFQVVLPARVA